MLKPKILPEDIEGMSFMDYRKLFIKELKRMKSACSEPGSTTNFMIMTEWGFSDFPGKEIPIIVVGDFKGTWDKYYKNTARKRAQKDFAFGNCSFGKETQEGEEFNLEIRHGRIKSKGARALEKVLFKKVGLVLNVIEKGGADNEEEEVETEEKVTKVGGVAATVSSKFGNAHQEEKKTAPKKKEELIAMYQEQADMLKSASEEMKAKFATIKNEVAAKVKSGNIVRKDLLAVRDLQEAYKGFLDAYNNADLKLQSKFANAKKALDGQNKEFVKLALLVKGRKQTLAQQLADKFFSKKGGRIATTEEIQQMQTSLKTALDYRQITLREGDEKQLNIKAVYLTAMLKGPAFMPTHTDVVYDKLLQPKG